MQNLRSARPHKIIAYLEGNVTVDHPHDGQAHAETGKSAQSLADDAWLGRFYSSRSIQMRAPVKSAEPQVKPAIYRRALAARDPHRDRRVAPAQFSQVEPIPAPAPSAAVVPSRRIRVFPRSSVPVQARWFPSAGGSEWIAVIDSGVNVIIDGLDRIGSVDVATDRLVIWTRGQQPDLSGQSRQSSDTPLEFYMEGNIVFRQGNRVIYAKSMYYDVRREAGVGAGGGDVDARAELPGPDPPQSGRPAATRPAPF